MTDPSNDVFARYAGFYDALYRDKDYEAECDFLVRTFQEYGSGTRSVLDLGCGTGGHVLPLVRRGFEGVGVDRSSAMVAQAREKADQAGIAASFHVGDVCDVYLERTFDAVISMFAVISYQCSNDDLAAMCSTARRHLDPGGLFVFDGWFGPAVITQKPQENSKVIEDAQGEVIRRTARPSLDLIAHTVEVAYEVTRESDGRVLDEASETHKVRFLFPQEIAHFLHRAGFEFLAIGPFMDFSVPPTEEHWNFSVVARAV